MTLYSIEQIDKYLIDSANHREIRLIQQHHTSLPDYTSWTKKPDHLYWQRSMENSHKARGFAEIAQHFTIFPDGKIVTGRSINTIPAGIKGANEHGICIEYFGNFDVEAMTKEQQITGVLLTKKLLTHFALHPSTDTVVYHHWYDLDSGHRTNGTGNVKTCPGILFFGGNTVEACEKNFIPLLK